MHMNRTDISRAQREASNKPQAGETSRSNRKPERRAHRRYSITAELEYRITKRQKLIVQGRGQTIDISSTGVLFEAPLPLPLGLKIEVVITWPARPTNLHRLELHAEGYTVRTERNCTAVLIKRYAFRGQGDRSQHQAS